MTRAGVGPDGMRWLVLATMASWGLNLPVMKLLLPVFGTLSTSALRLLVATALLTAVGCFSHRAWPRLTARQWLALLLCGAVMVYANQIFLMQGMRRTSATHTALIIALNPLLASLLAAVLLKVRLRGSRLLGVLLGFGGVALVIGHQSSQGTGSSVLGDSLVLGAVVTWVIGGVMVQRLAGPGLAASPDAGPAGAAVGIDSGTVTWAVNLVGAALLTLHLLIDGGPWVLPDVQVSAGVIGMLLLSGVVATALGALVWNHALATLGIAHVSLYVYWVPIFGVAFSVLLLGEPLTRWHLIGLAAVLAGTWLGTRGAVRPNVPAGE